MKDSFFIYVLILHLQLFPYFKVSFRAALEVHKIQKSLHSVWMNRILEIHEGPIRLCKSEVTWSWFSLIVRKCFLENQLSIFPPHFNVDHHYFSCSSHQVLCRKRKKKALFGSALSGWFTERTTSGGIILTLAFPKNQQFQNIDNLQMHTY